MGIFLSIMRVHDVVTNKYDHHHQLVTTQLPLPAVVNLKECHIVVHLKLSEH